MALQTVSMRRSCNAVHRHQRNPLSKNLVFSGGKYSILAWELTARYQ